MKKIFEWLSEHFFSSRIAVVGTVMVCLFALLVGRLFVLQILRGQDYQDNYDLLIEKQVTIPATRGLIYDINGEALAWNELSYAVTIEDSGSYRSVREKNETLNIALARLIFALERNGDRERLIDSFGIVLNSKNEYEFSVTGSALNRFRADIFGRRSSSELIYNSRYGIDERVATADEIMAYLCGDNRYQIRDSYKTEDTLLVIDRPTALQIAAIRYTMSLNAYQKYISATIATGVSEKTVAYIKENHDILPGVDILESYERRYTDPEVFSSLVGYTGTISTEEYNERVETDDTVSLTDQVGKTGLEKAMDAELIGRKGRETVFADYVGNPLMVIDHVDPVSGNNIYTSIDASLSRITYRLLEQEVSGIFLNRLRNVKAYVNDTESDVQSSREIIAIYDVYEALINNHLLDVNLFGLEQASDAERSILSAFEEHKAWTLYSLAQMLLDENAAPYRELDDEFQELSTYVVTSLKSREIFDVELIEDENEMQMRWASEELPVGQYLRFVLSEGWIDASDIADDGLLLDADTSYDLLVDYVLAYLADDSGFDRIIYRYAIRNDEIAPAWLCAALIDQGVLEEDTSSRDSVLSGAVTPYAFLTARIRSLDITPGDLGLDLCSASSVVLDPETGRILACVSYPGFDTNRLANETDKSYYAYLATSSANPFYNYATQQRTAPGSTLKLMTSTAGLAEKVITPYETITDDGPFEKVSNKPKCWYYPYVHGAETLSEAIRDSCNYYFYEVGYRLATRSGEYSDADGIEALGRYADLYGLNEETGIEIEEYPSRFATQYPVMAAIGQSDNNMTTIGLARYAAALANGGTVFRLTLLDHITDTEGRLLGTYAPTVRNQIDVLSEEEWSHLRRGMRQMVEGMEEFEEASVSIAGKTGTAQSSQTRASHALFIGYAPYESPKMCLATRVAFGYNSHYAAELSGQIIEAWYALDSAGDYELTGNAATVTDTLSGD